MDTLQPLWRINRFIRYMKKVIFILSLLTAFLMVAQTGCSFWEVTIGWELNEEEEGIREKSEVSEYLSSSHTKPILKGHAAHIRLVDYKPLSLEVLPVASPKLVFSRFIRYRNYRC